MDDGYGRFQREVEQEMRCAMYQRKIRAYTRKCKEYGRRCRLEYAWFVWSGLRRKLVGYALIWAGIIGIIWLFASQ